MKVNFDEVSINTNIVTDNNDISKENNQARNSLATNNDLVSLIKLHISDAIKTLQTTKKW